jgi:hypothetical protein
MNDIIVSSSDNEDFMKYVKNYDKNKSNIIEKDDEWYYNDKKFVTNTHLGKIIEGGPQKLQAYYQYGGKDNSNFIIGRALHCYLLEKELFNSRYIVIDDTDIKNDIGGARPNATKLYKEWYNNIIELNPNKEALSLEEFDTIKNMIDRAMSYKQLEDLVNAATKKETIYHKTINGVNCKCKVDGINPTNFLLDYKSTSKDATIYNFKKSLYSFGYDRAASFYKDITGVNSFWFIVQQKHYPYTVCLAEVSETTFEEGRNKYMKALDEYKKHFMLNPGIIDKYLEMGSI